MWPGSTDPVRELRRAGTAAEARVADVTLAQVSTDEQREDAGPLVREYLAALNAHLLLEYGLSFDAGAMIRSDLSDAHKFRPPDGRFYVARHGGHVAGVGALRQLDRHVGELQRMYVRPAFRGSGIGLALATRLIEDARTIGYRRLRLESLEFLKAAHGLYRSLGFREIDAYAHNGMGAYQSHHQLDRHYGITVFMEMDL